MKGLLFALVIAAGAASAPLAAPQAAGRPGRTAEALVVAAVKARVSHEQAEVTVAGFDPAVAAGAEFRSVRLDPAAVLGKPLRLTLTPVSGRPVLAVATVRVTTEHVVAARDIRRAETLAAADVVVRRDEIRGIPLRRLPLEVEVIGARTLRPIPAGAVFLPGAVALRRIVEPGDSVTVVARAGDAEVSAVLVAADGGDPGDVIRVSNPETRKAIKARVLSSGVVEVLNVR